MECASLMSTAPHAFNRKTAATSAPPGGYHEIPRCAPPRLQMLSVFAGIVVSAISFSGAASLRAQQAEAADVHHNEYTLKAVYLYSFGRYIEWPKNAFDSASAPFVIGILGEDSFGGR